MKPRSSPRARRWLAVFVAALALGSARAEAPRAAGADEIFYLIFPRSFYDSNGDTKGDLRGIEEKLGYLQGLGVTTLVLTPLYRSPYYHSYFADDFAQIDPAYGTEADLRHLIRALHRRGMKIFLDQEIQYVTANHTWFADSLNHPGSPYSGYIVYNGPGNTRPEAEDLPSYDGTKTPVALVNLYNPAVLKYQTKLFEHWMTPAGRRGADDGVDGFRIDHMMDDLDNLGKLDHLFARFWTPLFQQLRAYNPRIRILAEQANWKSYGTDWFVRGHVDMVYAFNLRQAIVSFDKRKLAEAATQTWQKTPPGKEQLIFIENHDTMRFASAVDGDLRREKVGAALNLLLKGIPLIYYGQEVGMEGKQLKTTGSDANDIPVREAFPWTSTVRPGMAVWYRNSGPWWTQSPLAKGRYPSLEAEAKEPDSIFSFYKYLIALRRAHPELIDGGQTIVANDSDQVFSFVRSDGARSLLVSVNLSDSPQAVQVGGSVPVLQEASLRNIRTGEVVRPRADGSFALRLPPYGIGLFAVKGSRAVAAPE